MTSLAHQLKRLALPQNDPNLLTRKEVSSLLFDQKDASTMDRSTFYALGCNGLEALLGIEPKFLEFQNTLFSPSSVTLERSIQSKEVNAKLDAGISLFLTRLSPYFLLRPAQKCMEWLIHRFHIQLYNVDSLLACVLPYHETKMFVRVVQLLNLKEPTSRWNWLQCLQKPGVPLAKGTLITHCHKDLGFLDFICSMVTNSVKAYPGASGSCSQLSVMFSFYASSVVLALDSVERVTDNIIAKLLPYIQKGLSSSLTDHKAATYMIVCQLAVKVVMEGGLVDTLALQLCKSLVREPVLGREGLACLIVLLQHQREAAVGPKAYRRLSSMSSLVDTLQSMAAVHDVSPLLRYMVPHLVRDVVTTAATTDETESESSSSSRMFEGIVQAVPLTKDLDSTMARLLLDEYMALGQRSGQSVPALNQRLQPLLRLFESKYSGAMDLVLSSYVSDGFDAEQKQLLHQFISIASTSCGKHQILGDSDTSLLLSLSHPLASVRTLAVEHLINIMTSGQRDSLDEAFVTEVLLDRMKDDVPKVVAAALKALELYLDRLDPERTISCLLSVLQRTELSLAGEWLPVLQEAVRVLCDPRLGLGSPDVRLNLGWKLLPLLVITSSQPESPELQLALSVARSAVMTQHPLTQDWAKELTEVLKSSSERDFLGSANQRLVSTLTEKLASMDHISKRDALDNLAQVVEDQRPASGGPRARAAFLVLTQALLQGLGGAALSDTLHLLTAQRLYSTLQRPLLELSALQDDTQASSEEVSPASFSEALAAYLQDATATKKVKVAEEKYGTVLLSLLREFISSLSCHDKSFTAEVWWNPEKMDSNACCYLRLLCHLFELLLRGSSGGRAAPSFRLLMKFFFQVHLKEAASVFKFLCVLWGYGANQGDQLELRVSVILQTQALCVGRALLAAQPASTLEELASVNSPVVHSLLGCLCSPTQEVREAAVGCLQSLSQAAASPFQPIIERLLKNTEEIVADPSHLSQMLGAVHEECVSATLKGQQQQKRLAASMDQLIQSVQAHDCPSYSASTLLRTLDLVHGESVLSAMLPVLERLLEQSSPERPALLRDKAQLMCLVLGKFSEASAPLLARDPACLELFFRALRTAAQPYGDVPSCQIQALEQITKPFFSALGDEKVQQRLLGLMFDLLTDSRTPAVSNTIGSVFKGIAVDGQLVANELTPPEKPKVTVTILQTRRSKMLQRKAADSGDSPPEEGAVSWQRVTLILELLQHKKKLKRAQLLVPALFTLLSRSLEPCSSEQHSNTEYSRQLLLQCLLSVCTKVSPDGGPIAADVLPEEQFNVELVVQCVRVSAMPQTHHHALLLLGAGARMFPEKVLHNIMPIFTFMGAGIMRLDDAYSFQVINRTVQTVIPALLKAHEGGSGAPTESSASSSMEAVATRVMHVFADALPHVPEHRRLPIMAELTATLGPARFLWVLLLLLFKQHATHATGTASDKDAALERDVELWISLCCEFSVSDQLTALVRVLHYLMQLPQDKDDAPVKGAAGRGRRGPSKKDGEESMEDLIFNPEVHSSKELRHFKFLSVSFMAQLLSSTSFIEKVADDADNVIDESLQQLQQSLLEEILRYIHTVARCVEENADKPTAKFWRALLTKAYDVLDKVNALLPTDTFIPVIRGLMGNELPSVRRKAMDLLNNKLQHRTQWEEQQVTVLLQLTSDLLSIVGKGPGGKVAAEEEEREDQAINRQTALYSLKLLCRNFGADHQEAFVPVLERAVALVTSADEERNVTGSALLCIAEVVSTLKARAIPQLPKLMPAVLQTLKDRKDIMSNEIYLLSAVTALQRLVETLPHFLSPYLHKTTLQVCRLTHLAETTSASPPLCVRLASLRATLATKVPPRVLLPTLTRCYSDLVGNKEGHLAPLMSVLKEHITQMEREQLSANQSELTSFFLTALDFRAQHCQGDLDKTQEVEGNVIDCLVAMVMKLSEVTFRPLFFKLFDWSKAEARGKERLLTFYRLADCLAGRLKGLFVLFSGNLVKPFSDVLRQTNVAKTDEAFFASEDEHGVKKTGMLLQYVLDCMFKVFLYDTQRFLSKERSETLMGPLVDQLENTLGGDEAFQSRVTNHLLPCIGQFAVAMGDDSQWKPLNYQILLKTRHDSAKVRFSSLLALMELTGKLRENYNVLLPETIPFLAELMEDESEEVEKQVQKVLQEMETILGEPMQQYF